MTGKPWLLVAEFMPHKDLGNLLKFCKSAKMQLRIHELVHFAAQIAAGCEHLESACVTCKVPARSRPQLRIIHRDLAVRNVLIGEGNQAKIGDFGLAQYLPDGAAAVDV